MVIEIKDTHLTLAESHCLHYNFLLIGLTCDTILARPLRMLLRTPQPLKERAYQIRTLCAIEHCSFFATYGVPQPVQPRSVRGVVLKSPDVSRT